MKQGCKFNERTARSLVVQPCRWVFGPAEYGLAVIFITPLTILLAEATRIGHGSPAAMMQARFFDTVLGCVVNLIGGVHLHSPRFRAGVGCQLRRLTRSRLMP